MSSLLWFPDPFETNFPMECPSVVANHVIPIVSLPVPFETLGHPFSSFPIMLQRIVVGHPYSLGDQTLPKSGDVTVTPCRFS